MFLVTGSQNGNGNSISISNLCILRFFSSGKSHLYVFLRNRFFHLLKTHMNGRLPKNDENHRLLIKRPWYWVNYGYCRAKKPGREVKSRWSRREGAPPCRDRWQASQSACSTPPSNGMIILLLIKKYLPYTWCSSCCQFLSYPGWKVHGHRTSGSGMVIPHTCNRIFNMCKERNTKERKRVFCFLKKVFTGHRFYLRTDNGYSDDAGTKLLMALSAYLCGSEIVPYRI